MLTQSWSWVVHSRRPPVSVDRYAPELPTAMQVLDLVDAGVPLPEHLRVSRLLARRHGVLPDDLYVVQLLADGWSSQAIAEDRRITTRTVDRMVERVRLAAAAVTTVEAAAWAYAVGLLPMPEPLPAPGAAPRTLEGSLPPVSMRPTDLRGRHAVALAVVARLGETPNAARLMARALRGEPVAMPQAAVTR